MLLEIYDFTKIYNYRNNYHNKHKKDALANLSFGELNKQQLLNISQQNQFIQ